MKPNEVYAVDKTMKSIVLKEKHNEFCWKCCTIDAERKCTLCFRSYHARCLSEAARGQSNWICPVCKWMNSFKNTDNDGEQEHNEQDEDDTRVESDPQTKGELSSFESSMVFDTSPDLIDSPQIDTPNLGRISNVEKRLNSKSRLPTLKRRRSSTVVSSKRASETRFPPVVSQAPVSPDLVDCNVIENKKNKIGDDISSVVKHLEKITTKLEKSSKEIYRLSQNNDKIYSELSMEIAQRKQTQQEIEQIKKMHDEKIREMKDSHSQIMLKLTKDNDKQLNKIRMDNIQITQRLNEKHKELEEFKRTVKIEATIREKSDQARISNLESHFREIIENERKHSPEKTGSSHSSVEIT